MNLLHLKYAVMVEKTRSINKAAELLFMGQPNLSRAIKELEASLGIRIFKRTSKGIQLTAQGEEFMQYARRIVSQVEEVESLYLGKHTDEQRFSISVPRASYISCALTAFAAKLNTEHPVEIFYKETNSMQAVNNILQADYKLAILRYQVTFEPYFQALLHEKGLRSELITEFHYRAVMSEHHPLAAKSSISLSDLRPYIELAHPDPYVPSLPLVDAKRAELSTPVNKHIFVFERGSQMDLLSEVPNTFMWVSHIPDRLLTRYGLVEKHCVDNQKRYQDLLVCRLGYRLTQTDQAFLEELSRYRP